MEIATGFGYIVGPFFGGLSYVLFGYSGPFILFAIILNLLGLMIKKYLKEVK